MDDREPASLPYAFHPPFPATEIMQRGRLGAQEPIGPVGETGVVGSTKGTLSIKLWVSIPHILHQPFRLTPPPPHKREPDLPKCFLNNLEGP